MNYTIILLMDVSLTGSERGRSTETRFRNLATFLTHNGMDVYWISCRGRNNILFNRKVNLINDFSLHSKFRSVYPFILFFFLFYLFIKKNPIKVVCHYPSLHEGLPSFFINLLSLGRISYYIDYMDLSPKILSKKQYFEIILEKIIVSRAKGISVISPFLTQWTESLSVPSNIIRLIPLSISDIRGTVKTIKLNSLSLESKLNQINVSEETKNWIQQIKSDKNCYLIGYQGSIHPHQGLEPLLTAFLSNKLHSFYLLLAGGADNKIFYEKEIRKRIMKVNKKYPHIKVKMTGYLKSKDIQLIISLFDYGIIPKPQSILSEATFPSKSLRYLIEGVPIIATPSGWLEELAIKTEGILLPDYSIESLTKGLLSIIERKRLRKIHSDYIYTTFGSKRILTDWINLLDL